MKNKIFTIILIFLIIICGITYTYRFKFDTTYTFNYNTTNNLNNSNFIGNLAVDYSIKISKFVDKFKENIVLENLNTDKNELYNNQLININYADKETLKKLPNIGDVLSENIIDYRNKNGKFKDIQEIKNVNGIGEKIFEKIKYLITI